MAENARILNGSLELGKIPELEKDAAIQDFLSLLQCLRQYKVNIVKEVNFDSHKYSFGMFSELFFLPWKEAISRHAFKGVSQNVYQMIGPSLMESPKIGKEISSKDWDNIKGFKCDFGMDIPMPKYGPVYCTNCNEWHKVRIIFYINNQKLFEWVKENDNFLPNKTKSDKILEDEISQYMVDSSPCLDVLKELQKEKLSVKLHNGIFGHNGQSIQAYIEEIGTKVCEANFYRYEKELSKAEQEACGSRRKIFSMINREGKRQYISLDFAHGMFEYIDSYGNHIGEFRLTGEKNSDSEANHGFKTNYYRTIC